MLTFLKQSEKERIRHTIAESTKFHKCQLLSRKKAGRLSVSSLQWECVFQMVFLLVCSTVFLRKITLLRLARPLGVKLSLSYTTYFIHVFVTCPQFNSLKSSTSQHDTNKEYTAARNRGVKVNCWESSEFLQFERGPPARVLQVKPMLTIGVQ